MGFLPLVAQEVGRDACENNAAAYQTFKRSRPEGHNDHEDTAQDETRRDEQRKLQKESGNGGAVITFITKNVKVWQRELSVSLCKCVRFAFDVGSNFYTVTVHFAKPEFHNCTLQFECLFCIHLFFTNLHAGWWEGSFQLAKRQNVVLHLKCNSVCFVLLMSLVRQTFSKIYYLREISFKGEMKGAAKLS